MRKTQSNNDKPRVSGGGWHWLFVFFIVTYGVFAIEAGQHNLPAWNSSERELDILSARDKADAGVAVDALGETETDAFPAWLNIMGRVSSSRYAYGSDGLTEISQFYAIMPDAQKVILSSHMMLGGLCIILGIFQFWPVFRQRHRRTHRVFGAIYTLAALVAMVLAVLHLLHAGVENTYQGFVFYVGLWGMVIAVVVSTLFALFYIRRWDIARHLGWQAVCYAFLLTAPVQRYDWLVLGWVFPQLTQGTANTVVNVGLFWQCLLAGYGLFLWNRSASTPRSRAALSPRSTGTIAAFAGLLAVLLAMITTARQVLFDTYSPTQFAFQSLLPPGIANSYGAIFGHGLVDWLFVVALSLTALGALFCIIVETTRTFVVCLTNVAALTAGAVQCSWGLEQGAPSLTLPAGGTFFLLSGISLCVFSLASWFAHWRGHTRLQREWTNFVFCFAFAPAILQWTLMLFHQINFVPFKFIGKGHAYMLAANFALSLCVLLGLIAAIYGRETDSRLIQ